MSSGSAWPQSLLGPHPRVSGETSCAQATAPQRTGPDPLVEVIARATPPGPDEPGPFDYDKWCRAYWEAWRLVPPWSRLPPELRLTRWVERWFFDQPMAEFDPECDVEHTGYPSRPVDEVKASPYL